MQNQAGVNVVINFRLIASTVASTHVLVRVIIRLVCIEGAFVDGRTCVPIELTGTAMGKDLAVRLFALNLPMVA